MFRFKIDDGSFLDCVQICFGFGSLTISHVRHKPRDGDSGEDADDGDDDHQLDERKTFVQRILKKKSYVQVSQIFFLGTIRGKQAMHSQRP